MTDTLDALLDPADAVGDEPDAEDETACDGRRRAKRRTPSVTREGHSAAEWSRIDALTAHLTSTDANERAEAVAGLCAAFEPLAKSLARNYLRSVSESDLEDLRQVARLGIVSACETFSAEKGKFTTHATWAMRAALSDYVTNTGHLIRLPLVMMRYLPKLHRVQGKLRRELARKPTDEEIAEAMEKPVAKVAEMMAFTSRGTLMSLDVPRERGAEGGEEDEAWVESYPSPDHTPEEALIAQQEIAELKAVMAERETMRAAARCRREPTESADGEGDFTRLSALASTGSVAHPNDGRS